LRVCRPLLRVYRPLLRVYRPLLRVYRPLLRVCRPLLRVYRPFLRVYRPLLRVYRPLLRVEWSHIYFQWSQWTVKAVEWYRISSIQYDIFLPLHFQWSHIEYDSCIRMYTLKLAFILDPRHWLQCTFSGVIFYMTYESELQSVLHQNVHSEARFHVI